MEGGNYEEIRAHENTFHTFIHQSITRYDFAHKRNFRDRPQYLSIIIIALIRYTSNL